MIELFGSIIYAKHPSKDKLTKLFTELYQHRPSSLPASSQLRDFVTFWVFTFLNNTIKYY